jgi:hypothetical protein
MALWNSGLNAAVSRLAAGLLIALAIVMLPLTTAAVTDTQPPVDTRPVVASNDFLPAERSLSECLSVLPKPGCGSEARGGWAQTAVFLALIGGLGVIGTRIVIGIRRRDAALRLPDQS